MGRNKKWTPEKLEELQGMLDKRTSYKEIAAKYEINEKSLVKVIIDNNLKGKKYRLRGTVKWDEESLAEVQRLIDRGTPYKDIAYQYYMTVQSLHAFIAAHGLKGKNHYEEWTPDKLENIKKMVKEGLTGRAIAYKYKVAPATIYAVIGKYNLRA